MKSLKPSHRDKRRYLLIKGVDANKNNVEKSILEFIGLLGYAESAINFVKINKNNLIIAINRGALDKVRTSFLLSGKDIKIIKVSGAIKKLNS